MFLKSHLCHAAEPTTVLDDMQFAAAFNTVRNPVPEFSVVIQMGANDSARRILWKFPVMPRRGIKRKLPSIKDSLISLPIRPDCPRKAQCFTFFP